MTPVDAFLRPEALPVLLLGPLAGLGLWLRGRALARRLTDAAGPRSPGLSATLSAPRRRLRHVLFGTALLLALLAAVGPVWGERAQDAGGADLVVCLDVSRSMLAADVEPSRLERARREIRALSERSAGDRLALVLFAGEARLAVPLTRDLDSYRLLLGAADTHSIPTGGTNLGAALDVAGSAFPAGSGPGAILLLTDGEDHAGTGAEAAEALRKRGIAVHCVGYGTELGAKIPVEGPGGGAFLRDVSGREVVTTVNASWLRRFAEATGGSYARGDEPTGALAGLYEDEILSMGRSPRPGDEDRDRENRFQWPLLAAFLLWTVDLCAGDRRKR